MRTVPLVASPQYRACFFEMTRRSRTSIIAWCAWFLLYGIVVYATYGSKIHDFWELVPLSVHQDIAFIPTRKVVVTQTETGKTEPFAGRSFKDAAPIGLDPGQIIIGKATGILSRNRVTTNGFLASETRDEYSLQLAYVGETESETGGAAAAMSLLLSDAKKISGESRWYNDGDLEIGHWRASRVDLFSWFMYKYTAATALFTLLCMVFITKIISQTLYRCKFARCLRCGYSIATSEGGRIDICSECGN